MPITENDLLQIRQDPDVKIHLNGSRIVEGNQSLIRNAIGALGFADTFIAELQVRFSLVVANNELSRPGVFVNAEAPRRGVISKRYDNSPVTPADLVTINNDAGVISALQLSEITSFELVRIAAAVRTAAAPLGFGAADVDALFFCVDLNFAAGVTSRATCSTTDCPKTVRSGP